ncbi:MAG TPA: protein kinase, partial [Gemmatimonadaceae bacterium]|nr:protein kinase [Gemmatimonadaceae bacterium]
FLREAQAAASLQHPNVVSIYDMGEVDGHLYIAMEFVQGADLEALYLSATPMSLQEKLDIVIDVLTGLTFAHKRGIVHRDIKPANIRIAEDGRAKLMDFGVAHLASSNLTNTGASLGTPVYMSPEQITGGKATPATDVFAVGAVLYELLTGKKPFDAPTLQSLFYKILTEKPKPIREVTPGLPSALDHIVEKAMAKDPGQRYQTALDMANDLSAVRAVLSGPGYPSSVSLSATVEHAIRQSQRAARVRTVRRDLIVAGAMLAAVLVFAVWFQTTGQSSTRVAASDSTATPASASSRAVAPAPRESAATLTPPAPPPTVATARPDSATPAPPPAPVAQRPTRTPAPAPTERVARATSPSPSRNAPKSAGRVEEKSAARPAPPTPAPSTTVASALPGTTQPSLTQPTVQQGIAAPRPVPPPVSAPTQSPSETPPAAPATPTAADVAPVLEAYARAIESRDPSAIRRVYPGLTAEQQRGFEQFFESARKINVTFRIANVEGTASTAEARVSGSYAYESSSGRAERQPVSFLATLRRDGGGWRLVSLR